MKNYVITNTILSRAEGSTPADVTWYRGTDKGQAMAALLQAVNHGDDSAGSNLPESMKYDVVSVHMDIHEVPEAETTGGHHQHFLDAYGDPVPVEVYAVACDGGENCPDNRPDEAEVG